MNPKRANLPHIIIHLIFFFLIFYSSMGKKQNVLFASPFQSVIAGNSWLLIAAQGIKILLVLGRIKTGVNRGCMKSMGITDRE